MGIHREESPSWVCSVGCPRCSEARPRHPGGSVGATHIHGITQADIANAPVFTEVRRRLSDCCQAAGVRQSQAHAALGDAKATADLLQHFMSPQVRPTPRPTDLSLPDAAAQVVWPTEPHPEPLLLGGSERRASRAPAIRTTPTTISAPLVQLVSRFSLEEALDEGAHPASLAYLEKLAEVLADGVLTLDEADDLRELATIHGLVASDVAATHQAFVLALAHLALADGKVSRAEREELVRLSGLLDLDDKIVTTVLARAEEARNRRLSTALAPLPASWDLGEPLRVGDRVVFTGCDEADRSRLETASEAAGVRIIGNVSGRTAMLVTDGSFSGTKDARARDLGTRRVTPEQYAVLLRHVQPAVEKTMPIARNSTPPAEPAPRPAVARTTGSSVAPEVGNADYDAAAVRAWARAQGIEVGSRGRLPSTLIQAYLESVTPDTR